LPQSAGTYISLYSSPTFYLAMPQKTLRRIKTPQAAVAGSLCSISNHSRRTDERYLGISNNDLSYPPVRTACGRWTAEFGRGTRVRALRRAYPPASLCLLRASCCFLLCMPTPPARSCCARILYRVAGWLVTCTRGHGGSRGIQHARLAVLALVLAPPSKR